MHSCKDVNMDCKGNWNEYFLNAILVFRVTSKREENLFHSTSVLLQLEKINKQTNKTYKPEKPRKKQTNNQTMKLLVRIYFTHIT